jgi:hypothetical protein
MIIFHSSWSGFFAKLKTMIKISKATSSKLNYILAAICFLMILPFAFLNITSNEFSLSLIPISIINLFAFGNIFLNSGIKLSQIINKLYLRVSFYVFILIMNLLIILTIYIMKISHFLDNNLIITFFTNYSLGFKYIALEIFLTLSYLYIMLKFGSTIILRRFPYRIKCPYCEKDIRYWRSSGMSQSFPHFYCNRCTNVLFRESDHEKIWANEISKSLSSENILREIVDSLPSCSCGGQFTADASPRCPHCKTEISGEGSSLKRLSDPFLIKIEGATVRRK